MAKLDTQPYKGTRDFYPQDMRRQRHIYDTWRKVVEKFGYEEMHGPLIELTDLYRAKTGEEIVSEQTYSFRDRGDRDVTIRPEMTPTVARMVAARQQEIAYPARWYSIANFWRYERPQHGRLREHWQLNADIFGVEGIDAEIEVIMLANDLMRAFGAKPAMYTIKINSRKLISLLLGEYLKLDVETSHRLTKLLDRKSKMKETAFKMQAEEIAGAEYEKLLDLLNITDLEDLPANVVETGLVEELRQVFDRLRTHGVKNIEFDLTLMRGFDYYTGIVFEVFDTDTENSRSIFGGGRYDELLSIFGTSNVPAVGFGMGDVVIADFLDVHNLWPDLGTNTKAYIAVLEEDLKDQALKLAEELRTKGINVEVDLSDRKAGMQTKTADKKGIPYVIFFGKKEAASGDFTVKELSTSTENVKDTDGLVELLGS